ncbi:DUF6099 family protein [Streptomyces sp. NPDC056486]|uniref:DUF6099 family protein n=1 Tax=Streptomyces sp. NPDC056486 TaxID=3345835 RepID=UPI0036B15263
MINDHSDRELDALLARADHAVLDAVTGGLDIPRGLTHVFSPASRTIQGPERPESVPHLQGESAHGPNAHLSSVLRTTHDVLGTISRLRAAFGGWAHFGTPERRRSLLRCLDRAESSLAALRRGLEERRLSRTEASDLIAAASGMLRDIAVELVAVALSLDGEASYWQTMEWIDTADEVHDRLHDVARIIPRLFDDATDTVINPVSQQ